MNKYLIYAIIGVNVIGILIYNFLGSNSNPQYPQEIQEARQSKDNFFRNSDQSPIIDKNTFQGLSYFEPNKAYKVEAQLDYIVPQETLSIPTSGGEEDEYLKYAWAKFQLEGKSYQLLLLKKTLQDPILFLAFSDKTSGKETYGGGRYIEIPHKRGAPKITIDFNLAFSPYCAYNGDYVCPFPPSENHLAIAIPVGEKILK